MAIAFARVSIHSRSHGHSAVAGAAYRSGSLLRDERTGETHNFQKKSDIQYTEILLPEGADERFKDRKILWNAAEACEKRKDAQLAKDVVLALPRDIDLNHQVTLAKNFAEYHFVSKGLVADVAIHDHGNGNPHAHIYVTTRRLKGNGFDRYKARDLNPNFANAKGKTGFISEQDYWDEQWRNFQNQYFEEQDLDIIVDENLLFAQRHEGRIHDKEAHYLHEENQLKKEAALDIALNDPESLINMISLRYSAFSERQLASLIFKCTETREQFQSALIKIKAHKDIVCLGEDEEGKLRYTTRSNYLKEAQLSQQANQLAWQKTHAVSDAMIQKTLSQYALSNQQQNALKHVLQPDGISIIVGRAGTGKSYLMKAAHEIWKKAGFQVRGMAVSGVAAKGLQENSDMASSTIASFKFKRENKLTQLNSNDIIVMDEAGMADLHDMSFIVNQIKLARAKLVLIGDPNQLQPIGPGAPFRALSEQVGFVALDQIRRQNDPHDQQASQQLALGQVQEALTYYENKGAIQAHETAQAAMQTLVHHWAEALTQENISERIILAHRNQDIQHLNQLAREQMKQQGLLNSEEYAIEITKRVISTNGWSTEITRKTIMLSPGDRILFRRNDRHLGVVNGDFATVTAIENNQLTVQLNNQTKLTFSTQEYNEFDYGYAATIHKSQGTTKDCVFVYAGGKGWDRHLTYVALTRHRDHVEMHYDHNNFETNQTFKEHLSRQATKDNVLDWPVNFAKQRGFDAESLMGRLIEKMGFLKEHIKDYWSFITNYSQYRRERTEKQQEKQIDINWQSPQYKEEWEKLRKIDDVYVQWMVKFYDLLQKEKDPKKMKGLNRHISNQVDKINNNKYSFEDVRAMAPTLAEAMQQQKNSRHKNKGMDIDF